MGCISGLSASSQTHTKPFLQARKCASGCGPETARSSEGKTLNLNLKPKAVPSNLEEARQPRPLGTKLSLAVAPSESRGALIGTLNGAPKGFRVSGF